MRSEFNIPCGRGQGLRGSGKFVLRLNGFDPRTDFCVRIDMGCMNLITVISRHTRVPVTLRNVLSLRYCCQNFCLCLWWPIGASRSGRPTPATRTWSADTRTLSAAPEPSRAAPEPRRAVPEPRRGEPEPCRQLPEP